MDEAEPETRRPSATGFLQQKLSWSWSPLLAPWKVFSVYVIVGLIFVPLGAVLMVQTDDIIEYSYQYDGDGALGDACAITTYNAGQDCTISFEIEEDMPGPVYVLYQLDDFYQNHGRYVSSYYQDQLQGSTSTSSLSDCWPLEYDGDDVLNPCGLIANTLFNDIITVSSGQVMNETGIAWTSDLDEKFSQPDGFTYTECDSSTCEECLSDASSSSSSSTSYNETCDLYTQNNVTYAYWYPDDNSTKYLYESYPEMISPLEGVTNEHFIVWMRTAGLPDFRKLYGIINDGLSAGETLTFSVTANFLVSEFEGKKHLIITTTDDIGGRSEYWGASFIALGVILLVAAVLVALKAVLTPRMMGDIKVLAD